MPPPEELIAAVQPAVNMFEAPNEAVDTAPDSASDTQRSLVTRSSTSSAGRAPRRNTVAGLWLGLLAPGYYVNNVRADGGSIDGISIREFIVKILEWK